MSEIVVPFFFDLFESRWVWTPIAYYGLFGKKEWVRRDIEDALFLVPVPNPENGRGRALVEFVKNHFGEPFGPYDHQEWVKPPIRKGDKEYYPVMIHMSDNPWAPNPALPHGFLLDVQPPEGEVWRAHLDEPGIVNVFALRPFPENWSDFI